MTAPMVAIAGHELGSHDMPWKAHGDGPHTLWTPRTTGPREEDLDQAIAAANAV
jgi:hypothetical protein